MSLSDLHAEGVRDLTSFELGKRVERERIIKRLEALKTEYQEIGSHIGVASIATALLALTENHQQLEGTNDA